MPASSAADVYDGTIPFPDTGAGSLPIGGPVQVAVTSVIAVTPLAGLAVAIWLAWGHGVGVTDLLLMTVLYTVTGLGVTVGYHRYFTHRGFRATRSLRIALAVAGSMAFEGSVIAWVATHRRHHAFSDRPGDPHSPYRYGTSVGGMLRGLATPTWAGCSAMTRPRHIVMRLICSRIPGCAPSHGPFQRSAWPH